MKEEEKEKMRMEQRFVQTEFFCWFLALCVV